MNLNSHLIWFVLRKKEIIIINKKRKRKGRKVFRATAATLKSLQDFLGFKLSGPYSLFADESQITLARYTPEYLDGPVVFSAISAK